MRFFSSIILVICFFSISANAQQDSVMFHPERYVTLDSVIIGKKIDISSFIRKVRDDSTFYKAFKTLRLVNYQSITDARMFGRNKNQTAMLRLKLRQNRRNGCRSMEVIEEEHNGDIYDKNGAWNYYTLSMFASLFFTKGIVCNEHNLVGGEYFSLSQKSGLEKHKEQLKMLFFQPGRKIDGIPMVSGKTGIFEENMLQHYDLLINEETIEGRSCLTLTQKVKPESVGQVVLDEMKTWLDQESNEVLARNYHLSFDAGVYDFDVRMDVKMSHVNGMLVPALIRYDGNWKIMFQRRERSVFTATFSDFLPESN